MCPIKINVTIKCPNFKIQNLIFFFFMNLFHKIDSFKQVIKLHHLLFCLRFFSSTIDLLTVYFMSSRHFDEAPAFEPDTVEHPIHILFGRSRPNNSRVIIVKYGSCHCIFRVFQIFLPLFSWKTIVNLNQRIIGLYRSPEC